jgi:hypothetical protein
LERKKVEKIPFILIWDVFSQAMYLLRSPAAGGFAQVSALSALHRVQ